MIEKLTNRELMSLLFNINLWCFLGIFCLNIYILLRMRYMERGIGAIAKALTRIIGGNNV